MVHGNWRKLNGIAVLAAREKRRRRRVKDRPLADMVAEYLASGGKITVGETKWVDGAEMRPFTDVQWHDGWVAPRDVEW